MIKAVIFDVGGVLIRTEDRASRNVLEARHGLEKGESEIYVFNGEMGTQAQLGTITTTALWDWIQTTLNLTLLERQAFYRDFWAGDHLDEVLVDYIRSLRPKYTTAIISNWRDNLVDVITNDYPMADAFDLIVGSATEHVMKPDAAIFETTLERLEIKPEEAVFIDDFAHNIVGAEAVGMHGIHFTPGIDLPAALAELGVTP